MREERPAFDASRSRLFNETTTTAVKSANSASALEKGRIANPNLTDRCVVCMWNHQLVGECAEWQ